MASCTKCGAPLRKAAKFCGACGEPAETPGAEDTRVLDQHSRLPPLAEPVAATTSSTRTWAVAVALAVAVLLGGGVALAMTLGNDSGQSEDVADEFEDEGATVTTSTTTPSSATTRPPSTTSSSSIRNARLFSDLAKLREGPDLGAAEITTIRDRRDAALQVIGEHQRGWYRVRIDGYEGWIFGAFVLPPDPGLAVAVTHSGRTILRDIDGNPTGEESDPAATVLVTEDAGSLWEVLTPDGETRYVAKSEMRVVS